MPLRVRRLFPLLLGVALILPAAVPATAATGDNVPQAEAMMLKALNYERTKRGLVALRLDTRIAAIARSRSDYQAATGIGSHVHSGGQKVFDLIQASGIKWYAAGEIIAQNRYYPTLADSVKAAISGWLGSPTHRSIMLSKGYNYVGFGFAVDPNTDRRFWTGVFLRGPDRTRPWAKMGTVSKKYYGSKVVVTLRWSGNDNRLQVLTSGLRYYEVQRRRVGGPWKSWGPTTSRYRTVGWGRGGRFELRVRSRDRAGNWSGWSTVSVRT
jgi:uncharacterized protein YkwD